MTESQFYRNHVLKNLKPYFTIDRIENTARSGIYDCLFRNKETGNDFFVELKVASTKKRGKIKIQPSQVAWTAEQDKAKADNLWCMALWGEGVLFFQSNKLLRYVAENNGELICILNEPSVKIWRLDDKEGWKKVCEWLK